MHKINYILYTHLISYNIIIILFFTVREDTRDTRAQMVLLVIGLSVGIPLGAYIMCLGFLLFCHWLDNCTKARSQRHQCNVRTTVVATTSQDREIDLNLTPTPSDLSHTVPLQPVTVECPSQLPATLSSTHKQEPSLNETQLSSGVAPPSYDATLSFPPLPVIAKVNTLV